MSRRPAKETAGENKTIKYLISGSEKIIMDYLWEQREGKFFREIMDYLNVDLHKIWKKQTVNTFISRLTKKGLIVSKNCGSDKKYFPSVSYEEYKQGEAKNILDELYGGSVYMFLSAMSGGRKIDGAMADELRKILEED